MSTKEFAYSLIDRLNESQLNAVITVIKEFSGINAFGEVEPDEIDLSMMSEAEADDSEPVPIEEFAESLGIDYDSLTIAI